MNETNCINVSLFELHTRSEIDFTQFDYIRFRLAEIEAFEIFLKVFLCLLSLVASLFGNIMVIYSILIRPNQNKRKRKQLSAVNSLNQINVKINQNVLKNSIGEMSDFVSKQTIKRQSSNFEFTDRKTENFTSGNGNGKNRKEIINTIHRPFKPKPVNLFILNLCFCDLMIVVWCSWVHMVNSINENWILGAFFCKFNTFIQVTCLIAAISTLSVISLERFKGIVCTLKRKIDRKRSIQVIAFIWLFSIIAAFPILIYRKQYKRIWKNHVEIWCSDAWPSSYKFLKNTNCITQVDEPLRRIYYTFISLVLFFIPIITMLFSYCLIIRKLKNTKIMSYFIENSSQKNLLNKRRQKVNMLLIGLIVSFTICWSPVQAFILFEAYKKFDGREMPSWFNWIYFLVYLLAYTNSAINPIIYTGLNKFYKQELRKILNNFVGKPRNSNQQTQPKLSRNSSNQSHFIPKVYF